MTREQARAILAHIDLIKHFAEGGDIGLRLHTHRGEYVHTVPQRHIVLGNLREEGTKLFGDRMLTFRTELELISEH